MRLPYMMRQSEMEDIRTHKTQLHAEGMADMQDLDVLSTSPEPAGHSCCDGGLHTSASEQQPMLLGSQGAALTCLQDDVLEMGQGLQLNTRNNIGCSTGSLSSGCIRECSVRSACVRCEQCVNVVCAVRASSVLKPVWTPLAIFGSLGVCIYVPASRHWLISYSLIHLA